MTKVLDLVGRYRKAVTGFIAPGAIIIGASVTSASDGGSHITGAEWVTAVVACIVSSVAVGAVPNKPAPPA
jgi:hypothetical protein